MNKKTFFFLPIFIVVSVSGHECWLQPDKFIYKRTEPINIKFLTGENFIGDNWDDERDKINCVQLYYDDVVDKDLDANFGNDKGDSLQLAMIDEGTVMVTLNTNNCLTDLDPEKFDQYLRDNDLNETLESRKKSGDTLKNGHESYQRCVKTILQVGHIYTNTFSKRTDLPLDIVPLDHPYNVVKDKNFKAQVYFMGKKLKNTKIEVWHKLDGKVTQKNYVTNEDGEVKFFLSPEGEWMITCMKMVKLENDAQADWQSYWGSVTWGYY